jgi:hypothetical protein
MNQIGNTIPNGSTTGALYASSPQTKKTQEDAAQLQQTNLSADSINVISSTETAVNQTVVPAGISVSPAYSVEISEEGSQLSSLSASTTGNESPTGKPSASSPDNATSDASSQTSDSSASSATSSVESATDDDSASSTTNLSQYSDSQLKNMLNKGALTQNEYNTEIAKRAAKKQSETANAASTANADVGTVK